MSIKITYSSDNAVIFISYSASNIAAVKQAFINGSIAKYQIVKAGA